MAKVTSKQEMRIVFGTAGDSTISITVPDFDTTQDSDTTIARLNTIANVATQTVTGGGTLVQTVDTGSGAYDVTGIKEAYVTMQTRTWLIESETSEVQDEG